ncbi:hypothetical protein L484_006488 [Morus notabilis]|uniref:Uncharacterized protein n=1 Tax=Morus notabilis TaxID=981085 RepID=W9QUA4_9ROSA|nr:hypothetical protein L484_006488 [Morus notabilis]
MVARRRSPVVAIVPRRYDHFRAGRTAYVEVYYAGCSSEMSSAILQNTDRFPRLIDIPLSLIFFMMAVLLLKTEVFGQYPYGRRIFVFFSELQVFRRLYGWIAANIGSYWFASQAKYQYNGWILIGISAGY